jgi:hypothetical protein
VRLRGQRVEQGAADPRFADPGLADQEHALALAGLGQRPALQQQGQLLVAANHRQERGAAHRLEPALDRPFAGDREGPDRLADALELVLAKVREREPRPEQPPRRIGDHDVAGRRNPLQARRKVRCVADHGLLLRGTLADQIAHDHEAGRYRDPRGQRLARRVAQLPDRRRDRQPGPDRALGLVLMRARPAEIG